jgi:uncharacterized membrane protein required for colicin V production
LRRECPTLRHERRKLTASWFNAIAIAIMAAGAFAPVASQIYGFGSNRVDESLVFFSSAVCVAVSLILHLIGRQHLGGFEE